MSPKERFRKWIRRFHPTALLLWLAGGLASVVGPTMLQGCFDFSDTDRQDEVCCVGLVRGTQLDGRQTPVAEAGPSLHHLLAHGEGKTMTVTWTPRSLINSKSNFPVVTLSMLVPRNGLELGKQKRCNEGKLACEILISLDWGMCVWK